MDHIDTIVYPHPILREIMPETPYEEAAETVELLIENVTTRTLQGRPAVGLAANQIGIRQRVCTIQLDDESWFGLVNPYIVYYSPEQELDVEGCGSLPNLYLPIKRSALVMVEHEVGGELERTSFEGYPARIAQHEIDHLDGILIIDRREPLARIA